jgi:phosphogluconate dehydratase
MSAVSPVIARVTKRIRDRSTQERSAYLTRVRAAQSRQPQRSGHAYANLVHGFATAPEADKGMLLDLQPVPNIGIVSERVKKVRLGLSMTVRFRHGTEKTLSHRPQ